MQEFVTRYCWGDIWNRPGLSLKERSLVSLGMIAALDPSHEFKAHVRGALRNGLTPEQIKEVLLQVAVYVGELAALDSFRLAAEVIDADNAEQ